MKFFDLLKFKVFKFFLKKYERAFNSFYKNKLNLKLVKLQKNGLNINTIYDIGAYRGEWSLDLSKKSLKGKEFILFEANEKNEKYLKNKNFNYFIVFINILMDFYRLFCKILYKMPICSRSAKMAPVRAEKKIDSF